MNLTDYDVILVNTSGGKDSMAMLDLIVEQATAQGVRDRVRLVHADLRRMEWQGVRELVKEHASHYGLPLDIVTRPQGDLIDHVESRGMWPSAKARYCTSDHKRGQVRKVMTRLATDWRNRWLQKDGTIDWKGPCRPCRILNCMGLRAEESRARAKRPVLSRSNASTKTTRTVDDYLPIHSWTTDEVWTRIRESGLKHHKAYDLGMPRLSCAFCIFAPKSALMVAAKHNPELLDTLCDLEKRIGHTFKVDLSLAEVRESVRQEDSPVKIENWTM